MTRPVSLPSPAPQNWGVGASSPFLLRESEARWLPGGWIPGGWGVRTKRQQGSEAAALSHDWEAYRRSLSRSMRGNLSYHPGGWERTGTPGASGCRSRSDTKSPRRACPGSPSQSAAGCTPGRRPRRRAAAVAPAQPEQRRPPRAAHRRFGDQGGGDAGHGLAPLGRTLS